MIDSVKFKQIRSFKGEVPKHWSTITRVENRSKGLTRIIKIYTHRLTGISASQIGNGVIGYIYVPSLPALLIGQNAGVQVNNTTIEVALRVAERIVDEISEVVDPTAPREYSRVDVAIQLPIPYAWIEALYSNISRCGVRQATRVYRGESLYLPAHKNDLIFYDKQIQLGKKKLKTGTVESFTRIELKLEGSKLRKAFLGEPKGAVTLIDVITAYKALRKVLIQLPPLLDVNTTDKLSIYEFMALLKHEAPLFAEIYMTHKLEPGSRANFKTKLKSLRPSIDLVPIDWANILPPDRPPANSIQFYTNEVGSINPDLILEIKKEMGLVPADFIPMRHCIDTTK